MTSSLGVEPSYWLTTAKCTPIEEGQAAVFCDCEVKTAYSVGGTPYHAPIDSPEGKQIVSGYYPAGAERERAEHWTGESKRQLAHCCTLRLVKA